MPFFFRPGTVILDACVLYPAPLRDLLMQLALGDLFRARWTEQIHREWIRSVLKNNPHLQPKQLERTRELMNQHVRDCLVTDYETLIPALSLPDPDDRHVLAAAIHCGAGLIITFNGSDFPDAELAQFRIAAQHPDDFIVTLLDERPGEVATAAEIVRQRLKRDPKSVEEYLDILLRQGLPMTVSGLQSLMRSRGL